MSLEVLRLAHEPIARQAGLTTKQIAVIRDSTTALTDHVDPSSLLSDLQRATLVYTDWMTRNIHVPQAVFDAFKSLLDDKQVVEATTTIAAYNMVSRFLVALDVGDKADEKIPEVKVEVE